MRRSLILWSCPAALLFALVSDVTYIVAGVVRVDAIAPSPSHWPEDAKARVAKLTSDLESLRRHQEPSGVPAAPGSTFFGDQGENDDLNVDDLGEAANGTALQPGAIIALRGGRSGLYCNSAVCKQPSRDSSVEFRVVAADDGFIGLHNPPKLGLKNLQWWQKMNSALCLPPGSLMKPVALGGGKVALQKKMANTVLTVREERWCV